MSEGVERSLRMWEGRKTRKDLNLGKQESWFFGREVKAADGTS
jgi:hypothetical protein